MKKNIIVLVIAIIALIISSTQVFSMEKRPSSKKAISPKTTPQLSKVTGKVTGYNWANSTITVSTEAGSSLVISIDKDTSISKAKKAIKMTDIRSGDKVSVTYEAKKGTNIAKSIIVEEKSAPISTKTKSKK